MTAPAPLTKTASDDCRSAHIRTSVRVQAVNATLPLKLVMVS
jgi:hypothetical protein